MTRKILIAEDEWELRKLLRLILEDNDFEVIESENAEQTIEYTYSAKPDLIMIDTNLSGVSRTGVLKDMPVIMLCGKTFDRNMYNISGVNVVGFIEKPYEQGKIMRVLDGVFGPIEKKERVGLEAAGTNVPQGKTDTDNETNNVTKYYNLSNVSLKKVMGIICGAEFPDESDGFSGRSILLVVYSANPDMHLLDKVIDVFGNSMPVLLIEHRNFIEKYDKLVSLGLKMFEIEPEAFRRV